MGIRGRLGAGLVAVALSGCVSPPPTPLPSVPSTGLRVMTYNILGAMGDDSLYSEQAGWAARLDQWQPDVVVLEEAQAADVAAIVARTSTAYTEAAYVQWECDLKADREGVAILVKSSLRLVGGGGTNVGATCLNPSLKRVLVWADLELDRGPLRIYGTHLSQGGAAYDQSRDAQIRAVRAIIEAGDPTDARRWVLAGDLNARPGSASYRLLTGDDPAEPGPPRFTDTYAQLHPEAADPLACPSYEASDASGMALLWADPEHVRRCGFTAGWPKDDNWLACDILSWCISWELRRDSSVRERIDYVLTPRDGPLRMLDSWVPNRLDPDWAAAGQEWFRLSDHLPVIADLEV